MLSPLLKLKRGDNISDYLTNLLSTSSPFEEMDYSNTSKKNNNKMELDAKDSKTSGESTASSSDSTRRRTPFVFPPAPHVVHTVPHPPTSPVHSSDSSASDQSLIKYRKCTRRKVKLLPPIGVFWDIENCQVPKNKNASLVVQRIRELFDANYREAEFMVVCDVKRESSSVIQDLNDAQVNLIHVSARSKNAADDKLRQSLRRFAEVHTAPAAVVLISSDVNFAADLSDLKYRKKMYIVLIHMENVADALILCANETYNFYRITEKLPANAKTKTLDSQQMELLVFNLPQNSDSSRIKLRLHHLCNNCGGKVTYLCKDAGVARVRFSTNDFAIRAQRRIQGEDVCGNKISVSNPVSVRDSPFKTYTGRRFRNHEVLRQVPLQNASQKDGALGAVPRDYRKALQSQDFQLPAQSMFRPIRGTGMLNVVQELKSAFNNADGAFGRTSRNAQETSAISASSTSVELIISNLDASIQVKELRKILLNLIKQYAMVLNSTVSTQSDGSVMATVVVGSQQEAQFVISQLHHHWIGSKRISIAYAQNNSLEPGQLRAMVIALLQEVPGNRMPLFQFMELFESRFHMNISVSDINKLRTVCKVTDEQGGRIITLSPEAKSSPPLFLNQELTLYCTLHCPNTLKNRGWGEADVLQLPNVRIPLKVFSSHVHALLTGHMDCMPLLSFPICYELEFGQSFPIDESGVPLEHLVTCVPNVELNCVGTKKSIKYLRREMRAQPKDPEEVLLKSVSPSLLPNINMLCREVVELLKTTEGCQLLMSRYIPAYHNHFGRQCRVADYGFTRLIDLFEAISHVVQILNDGVNRTITLSHAAQMRRFTSDLLRVLKVQACKQVALQEFACAYEKVLNKPFNAVEYGLCSLQDLLEEVPENTVVISRCENVIVIAIPKREQTQEEIVRTKQFAQEVVELLRHAPFYSMPFNKFVPAYHHHFGRQCKVSDYGFTKLAELFEAIPGIVKVEGKTDVDKRVLLTLPEMLRVLGAQLELLIDQSHSFSLYVEELPRNFIYTFGYPLKPEIYQCHNIPGILMQISEFVQVINTKAGALLVKTEAINTRLAVEIWSILIESPHFSAIPVFLTNYEKKFNKVIALSVLQQLGKVVNLQIDSTGAGTVRLTPAYILAAEVYKLLYESGGSVGENNLAHLYMRRHKKALPFADCKIHSIRDFCSKLNFLFVQGSKGVITLNKTLIDYGVPLPPKMKNDLCDGRQNAASAQWSLLSLPEFSNAKRVTPPKPDTPPPQNSLSWTGNDEWSTPPRHEDTNLSIHLPLANMPKLSLDAAGLISPTRSLLPANSFSMRSIMPKINAPDPNLLPMPDKLLLNDLNDSGVLIGSRIESNSFDNEMDLSGQSRTLGAVSKHCVFSETFGTFTE